MSDVQTRCGYAAIIGALVLALVALAMLLQGVVTYRLGRQAGRRGE